MDIAFVEKIISKYTANRGGLISILGEIQARYGYLPEDSLRMISDKTGRPLTEIYGVATFYKSFSLKPRGKHLISVCLGTACHVNGGLQVTEEVERQLKIKAGETTSDKEFTLETVNCLGACALGPIVVVDGHYFSHVGPAKVRDILNKAKKGLDQIEFKTDKRVFPVEVSCAKCNRSLMDQEHKLDEHPAIRVTASFKDRHGWLLMSSLYGSYNIESEHEVPPDTVVNFFCPYCHAELMGAGNCVQCDAPMVPMIVKGGGVIQICSRRGCKSHMLELIDEGENKKRKRTK